MKKALAPTFIFIGALSLATPAHAYLDPGTGSMVLQLLLGGLAGALMVVKLYWEKIKGFLGITPKPDDYAETEEPGNR